MSVVAYFGRRRAQLRMPKDTDPLGIRYEGRVLTGLDSVDWALRGRVSAQEPAYVDTREYDAVLRAHCGR